MERIKFEHIAPYIPYGLEFKCSDVQSGEYAISMITEIHLGNEVLEVGATQFDFSDLGTEELKPIFRPLSDLIKDIDVIKQELFLDSKSDNYNYLGVINHAHAFHLDGKKVGVLAMPHFFIKKLFKERFDVFGYIEKGLAIDMQSIVK